MGQAGVGAYQVSPFAAKGAEVSASTDYVFGREPCITVTEFRIGQQVVGFVDGEGGQR